jgi:hypothetical protein
MKKFYGELFSMLLSIAISSIALVEIGEGNPSGKDLGLSFFTAAILFVGGLMSIVLKSIDRKSRYIRKLEIENKKIQKELDDYKLELTKQLNGWN